MPGDSVVGRYEESDPSIRAVDEHELVEVLVHTPPVMNGLIPEPAQIVDLVGRRQAVEHLLLQIRLQFVRHVPKLLHPPPQEVRTLLPADGFVDVGGDQPQPIRAVPGSLREDSAARVVVPELFMPDERREQFPGVAGLSWDPQALDVDSPVAVCPRILELVAPKIDEGTCLMGELVLHSATV